MPRDVISIRSVSFLPFRVWSLRGVFSARAEGTNNNVVERLHGTIKERTKVKRGLDNDKSAEDMMEANRVYYNYLRSHQALNGKTHFRHRHY
jgi:transposase-like protein